MGDEFEIGKGSVVKWWIFGLILLILTVIVVSILNYTDIFVSTQVERKVFEESYQYKAGQRQQIATLRAQLAEIDAQLSDPNMDAVMRRQLQAKQAAIRVQLRAATTPPQD